MTYIIRSMFLKIAEDFFFQCSAAIIGGKIAKALDTEISSGLEHGTNNAKAAGLIPL